MRRTPGEARVAGTGPAAWRAHELQLFDESSVEDATQVPRPAPSSDTRRFFS